MQCLVVGYGSIGKKHAQVLKDLGCHVYLVTSQNVSDYIFYPTIEKALENKSIDYVVIANPTHLHYTALISLIQSNFQGTILIEKPLFSKMEDVPENNFKQIFLAYNLRFHELLINTKKIIANENIISFSVHAGQYLPTWRDRDYRQSYSAKKEFGGGVLRDLSHELDYCLWLCGPCLYVTALGGHFSQLEINSDDAYFIMMRCASCPMVNLHINYLDRAIRREITINTQHHTIFIDLIKGTLNIDGEIKTCYTEGISHTYFRQHKAVMNGEFDTLCSYSEGVSVMKLIEATEKASASQTWMKL